jgi:hypothetical protein
MSEKHTPDPSEPDSAWQYASWGAEPTNIHVTVNTKEPEEPAWDWSWLGLRDNAWTALLGFWPGAIWARVLTQVHTEQGLAGAWFMGGAGVVVAVTRFVQRRTWTRRTAVWTAVFGVVLALPAFDGLVFVLTGGSR